MTKYLDTRAEYDRRECDCDASTSGTHDDVMTSGQTGTMRSSLFWISNRWPERADPVKRICVRYKFDDGSVAVTKYLVRRQPRDREAL